MSATVAYLGLGSNLGDRSAQIRRALDRLDATPGVAVRRVSTLRETSPVGGPAQPDYLNGVAELEVRLSPHALLELCKQCEREAGRDFGVVRNGPRELDLDLLLFGDSEVDSRDLIVPHPRMREREFVLAPLRELGVEVDALPTPSVPRVLRTSTELGLRRDLWRDGRCVVGVVPTMGALHAGHASLLERARRECDRVLATIFVNPKQFDLDADLAAYPRDFDRDFEICRQAGVDAVFAPDVSGVYPVGFASDIAVGAEASDLEGADRPGHFDGVATVVAKLLIGCGSQRAYFGQKDAQQLAVVRRLVADLGIPVEIVACPIVREPDGLALSSRNQRLGPRDRAAATVLFRALQAGRRAFDGGERRVEAILAAARRELANEPLCDVDYIEVRCDGDLRPFVTDVVGEDGGRLLVAAKFDTDSQCATRLIDNMSLVVDD